MVAARCLATVLAAGSLGMAMAEEEKEHVSHADLGIAVMLLGSIAFQMSLFYLVNLKDHDLRKYSWQVISSTISIFSAVMIFQGVQGVLEEITPEGERAELVVAVVHMLVWFGLLQFVLAFISGAIGSPPKNMRNMELDMKCFAVLLGHITGFATIHAFALVQQWFRHSVWQTFCMVPVAWFATYSVGRVTDAVREKVSVSDDGKKDEWEEKWDDETEETENDVVGLAVSFLLIQSLRFAIGRVMPNAEGEEPEEVQDTHHLWQAALLFFAGLTFQVLNVVRMVMFKQWHHRLRPQAENITAMAFAWSLFFASDWLLSRHVFANEHGMIKLVGLALFVTFVAFSLIFVVDKLADMDFTGKEVDKALRSVVQGLGILIGFSWERCFDVGVEEISDVVPYFTPATTKLLISILLALAVTPAWRMYILPTIADLEEAEKEREGEGAEGEKQEKEGTRREAGLEAPLLGEPAAASGW